MSHICYTAACFCLPLVFWFPVFPYRRNRFVSCCSLSPDTLLAFIFSQTYTYGPNNSILRKAHLYVTWTYHTSPIDVSMHDLCSKFKSFMRFSRCSGILNPSISQILSSNLSLGLLLVFLLFTLLWEIKIEYWIVFKQILFCIVIFFTSDGMYKHICDLICDPFL